MGGDVLTFPSLSRSRVYKPPAAIDVIVGSRRRRRGRGISSRQSGPNPKDPSSPHPQTKSLDEVSCDERFCELLMETTCNCHGRSVREKAPGPSLLARLRSRGLTASLDARLFSPRLAVCLCGRTCSEEPFLEGRRGVGAGPIVG